MTTRQYVYRISQVVRVSDGDTYHLKVDAGFHHEVFITCRLLGYDCPERTRGSDFEKAEAVRASAEARFWFDDSASDSPVWIRTEKDPDSFGRWLGNIWVGDDEADSLGAFLYEQGLASVWPTRWRDAWDTNALQEPSGAPVSPKEDAGGTRVPPTPSRSSAA